MKQIPPAASGVSWASPCISVEYPSIGFWSLLWSIVWSFIRIHGVEELSFDGTSVHLYNEWMEVHFSPEIESRVQEWMKLTGRPAEELIEDSLAGYKSGKTVAIDGEEAFARLERKREEWRRNHPE